MTNVTFKEFPPGNAELHHAAKVEPYRQGLLPRPTPLLTATVGTGTPDPLGDVTFDLTPRIEYTIFDPSGRSRNAMISTTRGAS